MAEAVSGQPSGPDIAAVPDGVKLQGAGPDFNPDERQRLLELRLWLVRRSRERLAGTAPGRADPFPETILPRGAGRVGRFPETTLPQPPGTDPRLAREFSYGENGQYRGVPKLHIGRGPDGRVYHRYVFSDSGPNRLDNAAPGRGPASISIFIPALPR